MAANALVQTRINGNIKAEAAIVLASMGLTVSDAVRIMLTRVAHDKALPFEPLRPNAETIAAMETTNREILNTFITAGRYEIVSDNSTFVKTIRFAYKRPLIKNTQGIALKENVIVRIYVPENFNMKKMVAYKIDKQVLVAGK